MNKLAKCFVFISLLIFIYNLSFSQTSGEKTLFWKISGNGLEKPSYLFGTMHMIPKPDYKKIKEVDKILASTDMLILEMIMNVSLKEKFQWAQMMLLPAGETIKSYTNDSTFNAIKEYALNDLQIKESRFNNYCRFKPFVFYSSLLNHAMDEKIKSYELHFSKLAGKAKISEYGLETFEYQMGIFDSIPYERQMKMFFDEDLADFKPELEKMIDIYYFMDIYLMADMLKEEDSEYAEYEEELLTTRNYNWAGLLPTLMSEQSCFIAVGAAHLAGENGLIKLLRQVGYSVDPVCILSGCN